MSGGEQLRDFLPVAELAGYLAQLALEPPRTEVINVCSGRPQSVRGLVESWIKQKDGALRRCWGVFPIRNTSRLRSGGLVSDCPRFVDQA